MPSANASNSLLSHQGALSNQNAAAALMSQQLLGARSGQHQQGMPSMAPGALPPGMPSGLPGSWQMMGGGGGMPWTLADLMNLPVGGSFPSGPATLDHKSVGWPSSAAPFLIAQHLHQNGLMSPQQTGGMMALSQHVGDKHANSEALGRGDDDGMDSHQVVSAGLSKHARSNAVGNHP
jgi:hypothetical protein